MRDNLDEGLVSRINDKTVISSANVIPSGRESKRKDVDTFVDKIKKDDPKKFRIIENKQEVK